MDKQAGLPWGSRRRGNFRDRDRDDRLPQYRVHSKRLAGEAALAEAQSSRLAAIVEGRAKKESTISFAQAEVISAEGAANAKRILQIQAVEDTKASLIYVRTEAGLPVTEARRFDRQ